MIKRYNLSCIKYGVSCCGSMQEHATGGRYVLYEDHLKALDGSLKYQLKLSKTVNSQAKDLATRDKLIGEMATLLEAYNALSFPLSYERIIKQAREMEK